MIMPPNDSVFFPDSISTSRLFLRTIVSDDLPYVFEGLSHPQVIRYYGVSYQTIEDVQAQMDFYHRIEQQRIGKYWAICSLNQQQFFGVAGVNNYQKEQQKAELGCWFLPQFQGRGFMKEVVRAICDVAFNTICLHRLEGLVETENIACIKALESLNFTHEGTLRDCEFKYGRYVSLHIYSLLNENK